MFYSYVCDTIVPLSYIREEKSIRFFPFPFIIDTIKKLCTASILPSQIDSLVICARFLLFSHIPYEQYNEMMMVMLRIRGQTLKFTCIAFGLLPLEAE